MSGSLKRTSPGRGRVAPFRGKGTAARLPPTGAPALGQRVVFPLVAWPHIVHRALPVKARFEHGGFSPVHPLLPQSLHLQSRLLQPLPSSSFPLHRVIAISPGNYMTNIRAPADNCKTPTPGPAPSRRRTPAFSEVAATQYLNSRKLSAASLPRKGPSRLVGLSCLNTQYRWC